MIVGNFITAIVPAYNEAIAISQVVSSLRNLSIDDVPLIDEIIVVDNNSTDQTASIAKAEGARVVHAHERGYGSACFAGLMAINKTDIVVFVDGDHSVVPEDVRRVCEAIVPGTDLVIGSRILGKIDSGAMTLLQRLGNALACQLLRWRFKSRTSDLGPLRAIRFSRLNALNMKDRRYGWTAEMQVNALQQGLNVVEIPIHLRCRIGQSKISGTWRGACLAGFDILHVILRPLP